MRQNATPLRMSLVLHLPREMHLSRSSSNVPRLPMLLKLPQNLHVLLTFGKVQNPLRLPRKTTSEPSSVVRACFFLHFDLETCFAPQRRALFRHFQKWSEHGVLCILTSKRALRHNGVQLVDAHLASWLRTRPAALASLLFDPPEPQIIEKNTVFRSFSTLSRTCILFLLTLSLL